MLLPRFVWCPSEVGCSHPHPSRTLRRGAQRHYAPGALAAQQKCRPGHSEKRPQEGSAEGAAVDWAQGFKQVMGDLSGRERPSIHLPYFIKIESRYFSEIFGFLPSGSANAAAR